MAYLRCRVDIKDLDTRTVDLMNSVRVLYRGDGGDDGYRHIGHATLGADGDDLFATFVLPDELGIQAPTDIKASADVIYISYPDYADNQMNRVLIRSIVVRKAGE